MGISFSFLILNLYRNASHKWNQKRIFPSLPLCHAIPCRTEETKKPSAALKCLSMVANGLLALTRGHAPVCHWVCVGTGALCWFCPYVCTHVNHTIHGCCFACFSMQAFCLTCLEVGDWNIALFIPCNSFKTHKCFPIGESKAFWKLY